VLVTLSELTSAEMSASLMSLPLASVAVTPHLFELLVDPRGEGCWPLRQGVREKGRAPPTGE
jgi:hypothetical protein